MSPDGPYQLATTATTRGQLTEVLPEAIAFDAHEFMSGPLLASPHRVGRRLTPALEDRHSARRGTYRVVYQIDDVNRVVEVLAVGPRSDVYRSR